MPDGDIVVADTSPLLNLALIDRLDLLRSQFSSLTVPPTVRSELLAGEDRTDRLSEFLDEAFITVDSSTVSSFRILSETRVMYRSSRYRAERGGIPTTSILPHVEIGTFSSEAGPEQYSTNLNSQWPLMPP
jgi:hypothetical protein